MNDLEASVFASTADRDTGRRAPVELYGLRSWAFITSHAKVLLAVARDPALRVADVARSAQISERSAYRILADLQKAGYVRRTKDGRRNRYEINPDLPLGDPVVADEPLRELIALVSPAVTPAVVLRDVATGSG
jgi:DNA-binding transcriptional ArsR family regulator